MAKPLQWKSAQARAMVETIAKDVAEFFGVPVPEVIQPYEPRDFSWQFDAGTIWTKAGAAEITVSVSKRFATLYFRFADPARAESVFQMSRHDQRLNRFSGKWNHHAGPDSWANNGRPCPETSLDVFRAELRRDFRKVADRNPCPDEVAAYHVLEAAKTAAFQDMLATLPR